MSNHTIKGFLQWECSKGWTNEGRFIFNRYEFKSDEYTDYATVRQMEVEVEVPDDFDPTGSLIAGLEELKRQKRAQLSRELMELDQRISKLQALPFVAAEAA